MTLCKKHNICFDTSGCPVCHYEDFGLEEKFIEADIEELEKIIVYALEACVDRRTSKHSFDKGGFKDIKLAEMVERHLIESGVLGG